MKTEPENIYKPIIEQAKIIQEALTPLGYEITGIRKDGGYSLLLRLSEIQTFIRISPVTGFVDNIK